MRSKTGHTRIDPLHHGTGGAVSPATVPARSSTAAQELDEAARLHGICFSRPRELQCERPAIGARKPDMDTQERRAGWRRMR
jgi:hypothetical protein